MQCILSTRVSPSIQRRTLDPPGVGIDYLIFRKVFFYEIKFTVQQSELQSRSQTLVYFCVHASK